eukprot:2252415-Ditylum_brightwellii.AAC.1
MDMLLNYKHTYPNAKLRFYAGNMQLSVDPDTAYLVLPGTKSCFVSYFHLESLPNALNYNVVPNNAPIHTKCQTIKLVVSSTSESECGGLFYNRHTVINIYCILKEIGHQQQHTKVKTGNKTANSFVCDSMCVKRSKYWHMWYH